MNRHPLVNKVVLFSISFLVFFSLGTLHGQVPHVLEKEEVIILFEEPLRNAAEEAADIYPLIRRELEKTLRWKVDFRPTVALVKQRETFQRMAGSNLIVAFAIPKRNLIVIDYSKMVVDPFSLESTLKHELCHLLLHSHIRGENLPKWLEEGIAQWVSGGVADIIMSRKGSLLEAAILSGRYIRIRNLTRRFPEHRNTLALAYEESKGLVEYIIGEYDLEGILRILNSLRYGDEIDVAIAKSLSISFDELERRWRNHLKKNITWVTYFINHLYEILFFLAALALIYGFVRRLMKKRAYRYSEEEEEP